MKVSQKRVAIPFDPGQVSTRSKGFEDIVLYYARVAIPFDPGQVSTFFR